MASKVTINFLVDAGLVERLLAGLAFHACDPGHRCWVMDSIHASCMDIEL